MNNIVPVLLNNLNTLLIGAKFNEDANELKYRKAVVFKGLSDDALQILDYTMPISDMKNPSKSTYITALQHFVGEDNVIFNVTPKTKKPLEITVTGLKGKWVSGVELFDLAFVLASVFNRSFNPNLLGYRPDPAYKELVTSQPAPVPALESLNKELRQLSNCEYISCNEKAENGPKTSVVMSKEHQTIAVSMFIPYTRRTPLDDLFSRTTGDMQAILSGLHGVVANYDVITLDEGAHAKVWLKVTHDDLTIGEQLRNQLLVRSAFCQSRSHRVVNAIELLERGVTPPLVWALARPDGYTSTLGNNVMVTGAPEVRLQLKCLIALHLSGVKGLETVGLLRHHLRESMERCESLGLSKFTNLILPKHFGSVVSEAITADIPNAVTAVYSESGALGGDIKEPSYHRAVMELFIQLDVMDVPDEDITISDEGVICLNALV